MQVKSANEYVVQVFSDKGPIEVGPWLHIGEFAELSEAIEACKKVVDDFIIEPKNLLKDPKALVAAFLSHGNVPAIYGIDNLNAFNVYDYILNKSYTRRSIEISSGLYAIA